jgi:uncharacterized protein (TIGR02145 family)
MQKITLTSLLLVLFIAFFSSCSQDDAPVEATEDTQDLSGFNSDEIRAARVVASAADLPDCSEELENFLFYIESEEEFQVCRELEYHPIDLRGAAGVDGSDGTNGSDGSSCEAESIAEGVVITCGGVLVDTLANGVDGSDGTDGAIGLQGADDEDNCPTNSNADQADDDSNGVGDVCDTVFTDSRDGQEYAKVTIGNQVWMAENLKYLPQVDAAADGSEDVAHERDKYYYVYDYTPTGASEAEEIANAKATSNYQNYGVLYNWNAAMDGATSSAINPSGVQGVCPDGWHLPSNAEWTELSDFVYLDNDGYASNNNEGSSLKAASGWYSGGNGLDTYGFSALPGGKRFYNGGFFNVGYFGYWWSATEYYSSDAYGRYLFYDSSDMGRRYYIYKSTAYSVRCVMNP